MLKIAVLGASGFIGSRTVEMLSIEGKNEVRPVGRSTSSMAHLAPFKLDVRIADALERSSLHKAFKGCDVVIHSVVGSPRTICNTVVSTYQAAQAAGVRRLVYMSTACVHGQAPSLGIDEQSPLNDHQPLAYNNAKVQAERKLLKLRQQGSVELVMLRPSIVFGPKSRWTDGLADELLRGTAYFVNEGKGICNTLYIDNLVHAIRLAMAAKDVDGQAFLLGDRELVTWLDLYRPLAEALGIDINQIPHVDCPEFNPSLQEQVLGSLRDLELADAVMSGLKRVVKRSGLKPVIKAVMKRTASISKPNLPLFPQTLPTAWHPHVTQEMALLHQCQYKLPFQKAEQMLGYEPIVSFAEGCRLSIEWLASAGYTVKNLNFIK